MNLLDSITGVFNNDVVRKASSTLGESESSVSKAVSGGIPALLMGIMNTSAADGGANLLTLSKQAANSGVFNAANVGGLFGATESGNFLNMGSNLLSGLLGSKTVGFTNAVSNYAGIKPSGAKTILSAIATVALSFIGNHALSNNLNASGLLNWLTGQRTQIVNAVPTGLNLSGIFDRPSEQFATTVDTEKSSGNKWLLPLVLFVAIAGALWLFTRSCNKTEDVATTTDTVTVAPPPPVVEPVRESLKVKLPNGVELNAFRGGIEDKLVAFLNDPSSKPGNDVWFDFDNLNFESESARITTESQEQVNNIAAILNAYPKLKIKIGGYTDVTGDSTANMKLSQDRADAVSTAIKAAGSKEAQLLGSQGYGSMHAKAAATAPDEEKRKDRRISVSVREK